MQRVPSGRPFAFGRLCPDLTVFNDVDDAVLTRAVVRIGIEIGILCNLQRRNFDLADQSLLFYDLWINAQIHFRLMYGLCKWSDFSA